MNTLTRLQQLINKSIDRLETQLAKADDPTKLAQLTISLQRIATTAIRLEKALQTPSPGEKVARGVHAPAECTSAGNHPSTSEADDAGHQTPPTPPDPDAPSGSGSGAPSPTLAEYDPQLPPLTEKPSRTELGPVLWMLAEKKRNPSYRPPDNAPRHMVQRYHQLLGVSLR